MTVSPLLKSYQRKFLRSAAHRLKPVLLIGQKGVSETVVTALEDALCQHELIKVKFIEGKEKDQKLAMVAQLERASGAEMVGMVGHTAIFFRQHPDKDKRQIEVPQRPSDVREETPD